MSRRTTTRPTPKAAASSAPSTPRIHPGCLIAATISRSAPPLCPARPEGLHRVGFGVLADSFQIGSGHLFFQSADPFAEISRRFDHDFGPHRSVAEATELGANQLVSACLVRGNSRGRGYPRHVVFLDPPLGHPEGMDYVERVHFELDLAVERDVQLALRIGISFTGVTEAPGVLLREDVDRERIAVDLFDVVEHRPAVARAEEDDDRRD